MTWIRRLGRGSRVAVTALLALACGDDGDPGPTGETGSIQVVVSQGVLSVEQGSTGTAGVALTRGGGFNGPVTVTVGGLPTGVTAGVTPPQLSGGTTNATVAVTVAASVVAGTYTVTVTASALGVAQATASFTLTVTAAPSFALSVTPATLAVAAGSSGTASVNVERTNFPAAVSLALLNPPAGISASFEPATTSTGVASLVVGVAASVAPGSYPLTIQGTGPAGFPVRTTTLTLTVTAPPAAYRIDLDPASLSLSSGGRGVVNVTLARTSFTAAISLAFESPPPGVSGTLTPGTTSGSSSVFSIDVAAGTAPGIYQLRLRGTAAGLADRVAFVQLTVTGVPTAVEYRFCDPSNWPVFFAYQDGAGAWQALAGSTSGAATRFAFSLTQGRGGVLAVFRTTPAIDSPIGRAVGVVRMAARRQELRHGGRGRASGASLFAEGYRTEVRYASAPELVQDGAESCANSVPTKSVDVEVLGVGEKEFGIVAMGGADGLYIGGETPDPLTLENVPAGPVDLVGTRMKIPGTPPNRTFVLRGLNPPGGAAAPLVVDFNGAGSAAAANATVSVTGLQGDDVEIYVDLVTANGLSIFWYDIAPGGIATRSWGGLSAASRQPSDLHGLTAFASPGGSPDYRLSLRHVGPVSDQSIALGPPMGAPATSRVSAGAYPRLRFQGAIPAVYDKGVYLDVGNAIGGNSFSLVASSAYLSASGSASAYDLTMPDVAGLVGFPAAARLTAGGNEVVATAFGFTGAGVFDVRPAAGTEFKAVAVSTTAVVP